MDLNTPIKLYTSFESYCSLLRYKQTSVIRNLNSENYWKLSDTQKAKVDISGEFKPFYGDTSVIKLDNQTQNILDGVQGTLYKNLSNILAEPLKKETFHITIHNFSNGSHKEAFSSKMEENQIQCKEIFEEFAEHFTKYPEEAIVEMTSTMVYPSEAAISVRFAPASDRDYRIIMNIRNTLNNIMLDNWPELHATLAYFKNCEITEEDIKKLRSTLASFDDFKLTVKFSFWDLVYQHFVDMNTYNDIFFVSDFKKS